MNLALQDEADKTVFISYAIEDSAEAERLYRDLKNAGAKPCIGKEGIRPGASWNLSLYHAIKNNRYFIPLFSSRSVDKIGYVNKELRYAFDLLDKKSIFMIPVRLDDCEIPFEKLKRIQNADLFPDWNDGVKRILKSMGIDIVEQEKNAIPEVSVEHGDITTFDANVVALKYAQAFHGADHEIAEVFFESGISKEDELRPAEGDYRFVQTRLSIKAPYVLFVGVPPLSRLGYREIRDFSRKVLGILASQAPETKHLAMTIHGPGFGLDETESFLAQIAGFIDAFRNNQLPLRLRHISIVDRNVKRVEKLRHLLDSNVDNVSNISRATSPWNYRLIPESQKKSIDEIYGLNPIESAGRKSEDKPPIFVAMPFKEEFSDLWTYGIERAIKSSDKLRMYEFLCERVDTSHFTGDIMDYVKKKIQAAIVVVAELTGSNPNVYLEVGYAWGIGKPTILLARDDQELMFDVSGHRCLKYKNIQDCEKLLVQELLSLKSENKI